MIDKFKNFAQRQLDGKYGEFLRYALVGCVTTAINFLLCLVLYKLLRINFTVSNGAAVVCANTYSYIGNKRHVFKSHCENRRMLIKEIVLFFTSRAGTILLEVVGVPAVIKFSGEAPMLAKIEVVVFVVALNYIVSKFIIFTGKYPDNGNK